MAKATTSAENDTGTKKAAAPAPAAAKKSPAKKAPAKNAAAPTPTKKAPAPAPARKAAAPARKAPVLKKSPFGDAFVNQQRELLLSEKARYLKTATSLRAEADSLMLDADPGDVQFDEESGEGTNLAVERDRDLALSSQALAAVDEIDAALERVEAGTYGICVQSGQPIPKERLEAIPWAAERVEYKVGGFGQR
ncbi:MAG: TraR/DksA C4-type zinc finger protein [Acidimicrobiia bacterium]|nr:TraR/DksA C4-type zinc finger protein [Acidimicrobiia bacterium]